jgi:hypothetical protein
MTGTFHNRLCTFMIISELILSGSINPRNSNLHPNPVLRCEGLAAIRLSNDESATELLEENLVYLLPPCPTQSPDGTTLNRNPASMITHRNLCEPCHSPLEMRIN